MKLIKTKNCSIYCYLDTTNIVFVSLEYYPRYWQVRIGFKKGADLKFLYPTKEEAIAAADELATMVD